MTYREVIKRIEAAGWVFDRFGKGGHMIYRKPGHPGRVVVPGGGKMSRDLATGTLDSVLRQAGLK